MSSDGFAIRVQEVSKHYLMFDRPEDRLKQSIVPRLQRLVGQPPKRYFRDFAALNHVSFDIGKGETVGIVGRNGSGKSTLLQIVCGTLQPSSGTVEVKGRIAALLELGAGFNPEFTGRENVFLNAAILGLTRIEVEQRFDDIAAFADIGLFVDQPVKTYSSGMYVRLAFAVAINVDPDILVVDEALAVGDEAFQRKCFARIEQIQERGGTILFVSHGAQTVTQLCSRAMLFDGGELLLQGRPKTVVSHYQRLVNLSGEEAILVREGIRAVNASPPWEDEPVAFEEVTPIDQDGAHLAELPANPLSEEAPDELDPHLVSQSLVEYERHGVTIRDVRLVNSAGEDVNVIHMGRRYTFRYKAEFDVAATAVVYGTMIRTVDGLEIGGSATERPSRRSVEAGESISVCFEFTCRLVPGTYFVNAGVIGGTDGEPRYLHRLVDVLVFRVSHVEDLRTTGIVDFEYRQHTEPAQPLP